MGQVLAILLSKYTHHDLLTGKFVAKRGQYHLHTRATVPLISFSGLHVCSNIIVEPSRYQLGRENVRDNDETTISKTAVALVRTNQKPAAKRYLCCLYPQYLSVSDTLK
jgi:hypothetical protein